jgi:hypothetical protein
MTASWAAPHAFLTGAGRLTKCRKPERRSSPLYGAADDAVEFGGGRILRKTDSSAGESYQEILQRAGPDGIEAMAKARLGAEAKRFSMRLWYRSGWLAAGARGRLAYTPEPALRSDEAAALTGRRLPCQTQSSSRSRRLRSSLR